MSYPCEEIRPIALSLVAELEPYCQRITVAGSIRREKPHVKDIELVAIPNIEDMQQLGMFIEDTPAPINLLNAHLDHLRGQQHIVWRPGSSWGPKSRQFWWENRPVDLFQATKNNWGYQLALRTGSAKFNLYIMSNLQHRAGIQCKDGYVWHRESGELIPVPDEETWFFLLGLPYIEPERRIISVIRQHA